MHNMAYALLEKETLNGHDIDEIMAGDKKWKRKDTPSERKAKTGETSTDAPTDVPTDDEA
jgi:hypothetical protein